MSNFWRDLPDKFSVLAPMDDVTDVVFRQVVAKVAAPDVLFTEFVATDGLQSAGRKRTMERLRQEPSPHAPLVAQIWGDKPAHYTASARDIVELGGFAGIDINFGCPERGIVARGCCGGMIGRYDEVEKIIAATKAGAGDLPVSVKTRIGLRSVITEEWARFLLEQDIAALTIHARTVREMSRVPAQWNEVTKVVSLRNKIAPQTKIIGNGDVVNHFDGVQRLSMFGADGYMIGRGIFHNIDAFNHHPYDLSAARRLEILELHLSLYEHYGQTKPFAIMKKFFKIYVSGWSGAAELRSRLMETTSPAEVRALLQSSPSVQMAA